MTPRRVQMITTMLLVWSALYLMAMTRTQPACVEHRLRQLTDRQVSRVGGEL